MTDSCYRCSKPTSETMIVDGRERPACEICKKSSRVMTITRMTAERFNEQRTANLREAARELAKSVREERGDSDQ